MKQILAPILAESEIMPGVHHIMVEAPEIASEACPGQFVTIRCTEKVLLRRPFSIHRFDTGTLSLLFAVVGQGTEWLANRSAGESLGILGPLGNGFRVLPDSRKLLLVAGGIGIAPLVALAEKAVAKGQLVKLLIGASNASQLYPEAIKGVEITQVTEDGSAGETGMVTDFLSPLVDWADQVFACGPVPMYRAMANKGTAFDGEPVQILMEQVMGCGVGACRGCAVPTKQGFRSVCRDGPVFELGEIDWNAYKEP